jgi:nicotinamidase-related amidase
MDGHGEQAGVGGLCEVEKSQLVIIDIQTKLGAAMPAKVLNRVLQNTRLLLQTAELLDVPVHATEQYPKGLGPLEPRVREYLPAGVHRWEKTAFSCARADGFLASLRDAGRTHIVVTGMEAHICVLQTVVDLVAHGFTVFIAEDAVCSRKLENYQNALLRMQRSGASVVSAESVVFEWLGDARHDRFKAVAALLP